MHPFTVMETTNENYPVPLITEAPDETIYGEDFRIAQEGEHLVARAVADLSVRREVEPRI